MYVVIIVSKGCRSLEAILAESSGWRRVLMFSREVEEDAREAAKELKGDAVIINVRNLSEENLLKIYTKYPPRLVLNCDCSSTFNHYIELVRASGVKEVNYCLDGR
jgi:NADPH:quinone reductase-like Zn-dependent oxidoreductase